nr:hypothetical protein 591p_00022 [Serratia proteamaculans]ULG18354.1 hypothetical protein Man4p_00035 [Serratia proteamaculans]ULG19673.1 hypothetical protein S-prot-1p1_00090 [Serratia proteamaculans]
MKTYTIKFTVRGVSVSHCFVFFIFIEQCLCLISRSALRHDAGCWKISAKGYDFTWHRFYLGFVTMGGLSTKNLFLMRDSACRRQQICKSAQLVRVAGSAA